MERGERSAPDENGGAVEEVRWRQLVAAKELTTKHVDGLALEKTGLYLGSEVDLGALAVVLGVLAAKPGDRLVGIDLREEIATEAEVD
jgi:hypothetical protein